MFNKKKKMDSSQMLSSFRIIRAFTAGLDQAYIDVLELNDPVVLEVFKDCLFEMNSKTDQILNNVNNCNFISGV